MKLRYYNLFVFLFIALFSMNGFSGEGEQPCPETPQPEAPSTPSTDSGPSGNSVTPSVPSGGGEGFGTVGDQLGQTFDPKGGGGGMGPTVFDDKDLLKKFPKDSPEWKELKKSEHQVKTDKENANRVRERAAEALKDLGKTRSEVDDAERRLKDSQKLKDEEGNRLLTNLKEAVRVEIWAENNAEVKEQKFSESLTKSSRDEARQALNDLSEARRKVEGAGVRAANHGGNAGEGRENVEALREAMHNDEKAEARLEEKMQEFNESVDKVSESKDHYDAIKAGMEAR